MTIVYRIMIEISLASRQAGAHPLFQRNSSQNYSEIDQEQLFFSDRDKLEKSIEGIYAISESGPPSEDTFFQLNNNIEQKGILGQPPGQAFLQLILSSPAAGTTR